jgi:hypothetical protein
MICIIKTEEKSHVILDSKIKASFESFEEADSFLKGIVDKYREKTGLDVQLYVQLI